jgi:hypothetical protein
MANQNLNWGAEGDEDEAFMLDAVAQYEENQVNQQQDFFNGIAVAIANILVHEGLLVPPIAQADVQEMDQGGEEAANPDDPINVQAGQPLPPVQVVQGGPPPVQVQGPPVQGPPVQGPPVQGPPVQGPPIQGGVEAANPMNVQGDLPPAPVQVQGPPVQGPPVQGPLIQGPPV